MNQKVQYRINGFVMSLINYHIVTLRQSGGEGTFLGKVSRFLRKKIRDEAEVTIETLIVSIEGVFFSDSKDKSTVQKSLFYGKEKGLQVLGYFTFKPDRKTYISLQEIEKSISIRELLQEKQKKESAFFIVGLFTHSPAKIGGFQKDMNYDTSNVQRFTAKFYELFPSKAFRPVDFAISNIGNTDFNPEEQEQRYTSTFEFVPGAVQNMERSLELMRKYVKKTIDSFEVGRRAQEQMKKGSFREMERKLSHAKKEQQLLLQQIIKEKKSRSNNAERGSPFEEAKNK